MKIRPFLYAWLVACLVTCPLAVASAMLKTIVGFGSSSSCATPGTTWNPSDKAAYVTLSSGNLTATQNTTASTYGAVRAISSHTTGRYYWEIATNGVDGSAGWLTGLGNSTASLTNFVGADTNSWGCQYGGSANSNSTGLAYYNGSSLTHVCGPGTQNPVCSGPVQLATDLGNNLIWVRWSAGQSTCQFWNNNSSADPAAGTLGNALHIAGGSVAVKPMWAGFDGGSGTDQATINTSGCPGSAFTGTIPSGLSAWN